MSHLTSAPRFAGVLLILLSLLAPGGCAASRASATFPNAAVAADHATASEAGAEILRMGGNAIDAAVATSFALSVVRPESCGIGGGGFMVVRLTDAGAQRLQRFGKTPAREAAFNYREMAPAAASPDYFQKQPDRDASTHGGKAVAIPGTVAGLLAALDAYGTLDRAAIRAAEEGFIADAHYAISAREAIEAFERHPQWKTRYAFVWDRYLKSGGVKAGDRIHLPKQAAVLQAIARDGAAGFYRGPVGDAIVRACGAAGGELTAGDLRSFKVARTEPLRFTFLGWKFLTMPPPSSGGVAMGEILSIYEVLLNANWLRAGADLRWHILIEPMKHAFADRSRWLGDPAFTDVPVAKLLSSDYARRLAASFDPERTLPPAAYGSRDDSSEALPAAEDHGTSHFCVVDEDGTAVACTETINLAFGSLVAVPEYGFILNNQMDDFTTRPGKANAFGLVQSERNLPAPGKRPLSSMTPTIVVGENGRVQAIAGASGGPRIITGTLETLLSALLWGKSAQEAVAAPRAHHQWSPDILYLEPALFNDRTLAGALRSRGHNVEQTDAVGNVQLIKRADAGWQAACDPRKGGRPAGF
jgi:gamma-glutamyltranspeptidase / glutathione hydrolase